MGERTKKRTIFFLWGSVVICITTLSLLYFFFWRVPKPEEIFSKAMQQVVELKCAKEGGGESFGSAVLISGEGEFVSNAHVVTYTRLGEIHEFDEYYIRFATENDYRKVKLVKYDTESDLSLLQLTDFADIKLQPAKIGDFNKIKSGNTVYAVGNGLNHGISITKGIVSLPQVNLEYGDTVRTMVQCDLIINEGNSGGALLDEKGKLIGLTTFRLKDNQGKTVYGVAFCIPMDNVKSFIGQSS